MAEGVKKCEYPADPNRCQSITSLGQCNNLRNAPSKYCQIHGGYESVNNRSEVKNFRKTRWAIRIQTYSDAPEVKSLREEIGILRMILEETLERCETETDLVLQSQHISDLVIKIEKLVVSCQNIETKTGTVLDKSALLQIAQEWIEYLTKILPQEQVDSVSEALVSIIEKNNK